MYLLISWVTNYAHNRGFLTCLLYRELHALKCWLKFTIFLIFRQKALCNPSCCLQNVSKLSQVPNLRYMIRYNSSWMNWKRRPCKMRLKSDRGHYDYVVMLLCHQCEPGLITNGEERVLPPSAVLVLEGVGAFLIGDANSPFYPSPLLSTNSM